MGLDPASDEQVHAVLNHVGYESVDELPAVPVRGEDGGTPPPWDAPHRTQVTRPEVTSAGLATLVAEFRDHLNKRSVRYDLSTTIDLLASFLSSQFLLFAGPSGTGKSTAARALQLFFAPADSSSVIEGRRQLIGPEDVAGYLSPIVSRYIRVRDLEELLKLDDSGPDAASPVLLVEEINLSPVEGYLSPLVHGLSGLASESVPWNLHHDAAYDEIPQQISLRPYLRVFGTINVDSTAMAPAPKVSARTCVVLLEPPAQLDVAGGLHRLRQPVGEGGDAYAGHGAPWVGDPRRAVHSADLDPDALAQQLDVIVRLLHGTPPHPPASGSGAGGAAAPHNAVSRRQLDQCLVYCSWFVLLAKGCDKIATLAGDPYKMAAENAVLHFVLPSLRPVEFGLALGHLAQAAGALTMAPADSTLGGVLRSRVERLASAAGSSIGGRTMDFWDRLS